jgi:hypothetical protein
MADKFTRILCIFHVKFTYKRSVRPYNSVIIKYLLYLLMKGLIMPEFTQKALYRKVEIFLANAGDEDIAPILLTTGISPDFLAQGVELRLSWYEAQRQAGKLKTAKEEASAAQKKAHKAANKAMVLLADLLRGELGDNKPLMNELGLQPKSKTNAAQPAADVDSSTPTTAEDTDQTTPTSEVESDNAAPTTKKRSGPKGQFSLAAHLDRWRRLCDGAATLSEDDQKVMTEVGWPPERIAAAAALVEAVAVADNAQQAAVQRKEAGTAEAGKCEKNLRHWYRRAVRRAKNAIEAKDPDNRDYWYKKLGF